MSGPLIIFHGNCPDGWGSAWWLGRHLDGHDKHAGAYGEEPPYAQVVDRDVFLVDFCYPAAELLAIVSLAKTLTIFDHHQTAVGYLAEARINVTGNVNDFVDVEQLGGLDKAAAVLDMESSGVGLIAQYVKRRWGVKPPAWLANIEDRDLWRFALADTPDVVASITSRPYTVQAWDEMKAIGRDRLSAEGVAINRYRTQLIEATVTTAFRALVLGHEVWCAASPYAIGSDVAGELAKRDPTMFAAYYIDYGNRRRFGLRSTPDGMDVAALAETVGGGGHRHASGFEIATP